LRDSDQPDGPPPHAARAAPDDPLLGRSLALVRFLRERCPWDARQDPRSLRPYLLEEAHEVADAIAAGDDAELRRELGDLLLNVAFQVVLAEERGAFDVRGLVEALEAKMRDRHPHIYGDEEEPPDWEALKARARREEARRGPAARDGPGAGDDPFEGVSRGLEPLSRALRAQDRMAAYGFDWGDPAGPLAKLREEAAELEAVLPEPGDEGPEPGSAGAAAVEEEVGDILFAAVNLARLCGVHPSNALLGAIGKFERRCRAMWRLARERELDVETAGLEELDALWEEVKRAAPGGG
jgi:MazG family protein